MIVTCMIEIGSTIPLASAAPPGRFHYKSREILKLPSLEVTQICSSIREFWQLRIATPQERSWRDGSVGRTCSSIWDQVVHKCSQVDRAKGGPVGNLALRHHRGDVVQEHLQQRICNNATSVYDANDGELTCSHHKF